MNAPTARSVLLVFVKRPTPGEVKTRLAVALGAQTAAELYRALVAATLANTAPQADEYRRVVCFSPPEAEAEIASWLAGERRAAQSAGDLGARMQAAFAQAFAEGAARVALIGSDLPTITRGDVRDALGALDDHDVVLGPSADGGYYLIALARPQPALFERIPWSSAAVLEQTLARARAAGLRVHRLAQRRDVDRLEDLCAEWPALAPLLQADLARRIARRVPRRVTRRL